jgi:hypothetical protein
VKSSRIGGELVFHVGLPQYAYAIGLKERDVLIFKVKGDPVINGKICDTRDSTERVISCPEHLRRVKCMFVGLLMRGI